MKAPSPSASGTSAAVSLGCDILDAHSVHERVRLNSILRLAELLQALLEELGQEEEVQA